MHMFKNTHPFNLCTPDSRSSRDGAVYTSTCRHTHVSYYTLAYHCDFGPRDSVQRTNIPTVRYSYMSHSKTPQILSIRYWVLATLTMNTKTVSYQLLAVT